MAAEEHIIDPALIASPTYRPSAVQGASVCERCGAIVAYREEHTEWHRGWTTAFLVLAQGVQLALDPAAAAAEGSALDDGEAEEALAEVRREGL